MRRRPNPPKSSVETQSHAFKSRVLSLGRPMSFVTLNRIACEPSTHSAHAVSEWWTGFNHHPPRAFQGGAGNISRGTASRETNPVSLKPRGNTGPGIMEGSLLREILLANLRKYFYPNNYPPSKSSHHPAGEREFFYFHSERISIVFEVEKRK